MTVDAMKIKMLERLFLHEKPTCVLLFIGSVGKTYISIISKDIHSTHTHTTKMIAKMEQCGLIRSTIEGRIKFVELTEYGKEVEAVLKEFKYLIEEECRYNDENKKDLAEN